MSRVMDRKITRAKTLHLQGLQQREIAEQLNVSIRTIRRYLAVDDDDETSLETIPVALRDEFLKRGEPLMLAMLDRLQEQLDNDELKGRDLILGAGLLFDKIGRLSPPAPASVEPEGPHLTVIVSETMPRPAIAEVVEGGEVVEGDD